METGKIIAVGILITIIILSGVILIFNLINHPISEVKEADPCQNSKGCDYYQCKADNEHLYNAINMYLLEKQNCLLEELKK